MFTTIGRKCTYGAVLIASCFIIAACGSDLFIDPAGECVTCTYQDTGRVIEACADGDGNITVVEEGFEAITSENSLTDFRLPHESSGATCR